MIELLSSKPYNPNMRTLVLGEYTATRVDCPELAELIKLHDIDIPPKVYFFNVHQFESLNFKILGFRIRIFGPMGYATPPGNIKKPLRISIAVKDWSRERLANHLSHELRHVSDHYNRPYIFKLEPYLKLLLYALGFVSVPIFIPTESIPTMMVSGILVGLYLAYGAYYHFFCPAEWSARIYARRYAKKHIPVVDALLKQYDRALRAR